jgi:hypothetical protein
MIMLEDREKMLEVVRLSLPPLREENHGITPRDEIHLKIQPAVDTIVCLPLCKAVHAGKHQGIVATLIKTLDDLEAGTALSSQFMRRIKVG